MGSITSKIQEELDDIKHSHKKAHLQNISETIGTTSVDGESYEMITYLWNNRDKIYRNRKLIDLIG